MEVMDEESVNKYPTDLEDAIEILKIFYNKSLQSCMTMTEKQFLVNSHHMAGAFVRNEWHLWWYEKHQFKNWPKEKPIIVKWFNDLGITHADDMSSIIMLSLFRNLSKQEINLDEQLSKCKQFWKNQGYEDGIFKPE